MSGLDTLKRHIKDKSPAGFYVLYGEEVYLRDYYMDKLKELLVPEGTEVFNLSRFDGKLTPEDFTAAIEAAPFMSERRLVLLRDVDIYKSEAKELLLDYLTKDGNDTTIAVVYDTIEYKPDARTKLHKAIVSNGVVVEFAQQSMADLMPWVKRRFSALGKDIDTETARYLLFQCGQLMLPLVQEISKIAAYCTVDTISRRHIDAVGTPTVEAAVFGMSDAICEGRYGEALDILKRLLDLRNEPIVLLGALGKQLRGLYMARLAIQRGEGSHVVMKGMGYRSSYPAEKLMKAARRIKLKWCRQALLKCASADSDLKMGRDKRAVMEQLLLELSC